MLPFLCPLSVDQVYMHLMEQLKNADANLRANRLELRLYDIEKKRTPFLHHAEVQLRQFMLIFIFNNKLKTCTRIEKSASTFCNTNLRNK